MPPWGLSCFCGVCAINTGGKPSISVIKVERKTRRHGGTEARRKPRVSSVPPCPLWFIRFIKSLSLFGDRQITINRRTVYRLHLLARPANLDRAHAGRRAQSDDEARVVARQ